MKLHAHTCILLLQLDRAALRIAVSLNIATENEQRVASTQFTITKIQWILLVYNINLWHTVFKCHVSAAGRSTIQFQCPLWESVLPHRQKGFTFNGTQSCWSVPGMWLHGATETELSLISLVQTPFFSEHKVTCCGRVSKPPASCEAAKVAPQRNSGKTSMTKVMDVFPEFLKV
jgi:hypothetical protein